MITSELSLGPAVEGKELGVTSLKEVPLGQVSGLWFQVLSEECSNSVPLMG